MNAPDDFSLQEVKVLIVKAMDIIEEVEKKREKREDKYQKRKTSNLENLTYNNLVAIEREIKQEKDRLEEIVSKKKSNKNSSDFDNEENQNVFG
jgi:hypothetical protein